MALRTLALMTLDGYLPFEIKNMSKVGSCGHKNKLTIFQCAIQAYCATEIHVLGIMLSWGTGVYSHLVEQVESLLPTGTVIVGGSVGEVTGPLWLGSGGQNRWESSEAVFT